ncbi:unnamed protein product [Meloidogyne enterolobii]|uniref:Uncharacterized protein n=1 Tax=Meloidogyne enterolobii TaxID=390850 RepID=A0ACB0YEY3_MELEN
MKFIFILIILFINALLWSFVFMGGSSQNKGEGSSYQQRYDRKIQKNLSELRKKNNCTGNKSKEIFPSENTQKALIKLYLKNNKIFKAACDQAKNSPRERWFNRFENEEYKVKREKNLDLFSLVNW